MKMNAECTSIEKREKHIYVFAFTQTYKNSFAFRFDGRLIIYSICQNHIFSCVLLMGFSHAYDSRYYQYTKMMNWGKAKKCVHASKKKVHLIKKSYMTSSVSVLLLLCRFRANNFNIFHVVNHSER